MQAGTEKREWGGPARPRRPEPGGGGGTVVGARAAVAAPSSGAAVAGGHDADEADPRADIFALRAGAAAGAGQSMDQLVGEAGVLETSSVPMAAVEHAARSAAVGADLDLEPPAL